MAQGIPVIVVDGVYPRTLADVVLFDDEKGGYEAIHYLLSLGHRRIACIAGLSDLTLSADRLRGYRRAQKEAGISIEWTVLETRLVVRDSCVLRWRFNIQWGVQHGGYRCGRQSEHGSGGQSPPYALGGRDSSRA